MTEWLRRRFGEPQPCRGGWHESKVRGNCADWYRPTWPMQPLNTWSNAAYGLAGVVLLLLAPSAVTAVQAACLAFLMVGSGLYHGWPTDRTNLLDHLGMWLAFGSILGAALGMSFPRVLLFTAAVGFVGVLWKPDVNLSMAALLGTTWLVSAFPGWPLLLVLSALAFLLSYAVWALDRYNDGWGVGKYGHGIWHAGTALALLLMALAVAP